MQILIPWGQLSPFWVNSHYIITGLKINTKKSSVTFSKVCENVELQNICVLSVLTKSLPISYLDRHISGKQKSFNQCWKLIQSIENILARWSGKCLLYGERIHLVNWIIASKYRYCHSKNQETSL